MTFDKLLKKFHAISRLDRILSRHKKKKEFKLEEGEMIIPPFPTVTAEEAAKNITNFMKKH